MALSPLANYTSTMVKIMLSLNNKIGKVLSSYLKIKLRKHEKKKKAHFVEQMNQNCIIKNPCLSFIMKTNLQ